ncbi:MAG: efflux RND transporter periplasmic adaptor subunit [Phycisphaerae bacterium]|nr:efflux RND transporter periplasmic adaptor subunit [Phycisphaerae bacterium]
MAGTGRGTRVLAAGIGIALMVIAVCSVFLVDWAPEPEVKPPPIRPLKTVVIGTAYATVPREYPGRVRPSEEVKLAFQVAGQLTEFPVRKAQRVEKDELLARLDPRDYANALQAAKGRLERAQGEWSRLERLYKSGNAAEQEMINARAAFEVAEAEAKTAQKALDDTSLRAPFSGMIADTYVKNFENVTALQPILSLQDVSQIEIEVNVPEERVARARRDSEQQLPVVVTFAYPNLRGRQFEGRLKEFGTDADPSTQTYLATFVMSPPEDAVILPGMTATVVEHPPVDTDQEPAGYAVPLNAVPVDGQGQYFVWRVQLQPDGNATVHRVNVEVGEMTADTIFIMGDLQKDARIAAAGVHSLQEGQIVRLLNPPEEGGAS